MNKKLALILSITSIMTISGCAGAFWLGTLIPFIVVYIILTAILGMIFGWIPWVKYGVPVAALVITAIMYVGFVKDITSVNTKIQARQEKKTVIAQQTRQQAMSILELLKIYTDASDRTTPCKIKKLQEGIVTIHHSSKTYKLEFCGCDRESSCYENQDCQKSRAIHTSAGTFHGQGYCVNQNYQTQYGPNGNYFVIPEGFDGKTGKVDPRYIMQTLDKDPHSNTVYFKQGYPKKLPRECKRHFDKDTVSLTARSDDEYYLANCRCRLDSDCYQDEYCDKAWAVKKMKRIEKDGALTLLDVGYCVKQKFWITDITWH
ncbi:hypothetical protein COT97_04260 [Candidatus Falkowbacteria bacterium CG10_big_fil_rev_8_21_14_0_10_39_11]|uniref:Uncharacterized protein n=1 Tax=Candidatus Falkowbacteria bacterium CG10_big_fil_rev_8_21_14_0_10_39_11 TaxID=1974565 RepID=A0A2H0V669_9BACT|nr:MAG: hypothetical protein COT97_04260 [Candidatus Falkowbacteria bacterium CG10_big_fil_rev_8_21_14_0_10_39_11]